MDDMSPATSAERYLQQRQFLVQSAKDDIQKAREAREGKGYSYRKSAEFQGKPVPELPGTGSIGSRVMMDEARRKRAMLAAARPGKTLPYTTGMSDKQLRFVPRHS